MKFLTRSDIHDILVEHQKEMFLLLEKPMDYKQAAEHLNISVSHLRKLKMSNKLPFHKIDGLVYFYASELNQHIKKH